MPFRLPQSLDKKLGDTLTDQLFPRAPRRMKQPTKDTLRDQLALAASEIERQRAVIERLRTPWWRRITISRRKPKDKAA